MADSTSPRPVDRLLDGVSGLINRPVGIAGRFRPLYGLNLLDRARGRTLEGAVRGKVVLITGASSGIGEHTAYRVAEAGATVVLVARSESKLESVRSRIEDSGGSAHVHPADLSDLEDVDRLVGEVLSRHGHVDVLVNNAGRSIRRSLALSYDRFHDFERTMQLNYFGAIRLILGLLPSMRARKAGHIVNVSSAGVQAGAPRFSAYVASKAALDAFSESAQAEVHRDGVRITTVYMPLVRTPMIAPTRIYRQLPAISPSEAADMLCDAITYRPRRLGALGTTALGVGSAVAPWAMDHVRSTAFGLFPDSAAARGAGDADEDAGEERPAQTLFGRLFPGVHW